MSVNVKQISENKSRLHVNGCFVEMDAETEKELLHLLLARAGSPPNPPWPIPGGVVKAEAPSFPLITKEQWEAMDQAVRYIEKDYNERLCRLEDWRFDLTNQLKATTQNRKRLEYIEEALDAFASVWVSELNKEEESPLYTPDQSEDLILPQLNQRLNYQEKAGNHYLYVKNEESKVIKLWPLESVWEVEDKLDDDVTYRVWRRTPPNILHLIPDPSEDYTEYTVIKAKVGKPFVYKK